jgi:hypothetical protein
MQGIKIFDHTPNAKCLVNISITPKGITCSRCETDRCPHAEYILEHTEFQKALEQKRKAGWNIP